MIGPAFFSAVAVLLGSAQLNPKFDSSAPIFWFENGWSVYSYPDEDMCEMSAQINNGEDFTFSYFPKEKAFAFLFTNRNATSLEDNQEVELQIVFLKDGKVDLGWGEQSFTASRVEDTVVFTSPLLPSPIDSDVAKSSHLGIARNNAEGTPTPVAAIALDGSAKALEQTKKCAYAAAGLNPDDPSIK